MAIDVEKAMDKVIDHTVVEQGTSDGWDYVKYADGRAVAEISFNTSVAWTNNIATNLYYSGNVLNKSYPSFFIGSVNAVSNCFDTANNSWTQLSGTFVDTANKVLKTTFIGWTNGGTHTLNVHYVVTGRWK